MYMRLGLIIVGGGQILLAVSVSGDNRESIEMLPDLGGGSPLRPAWERDFPEPCGRGVWFQADPLQPSPGGPGRRQTVGTDSTLLGPVRETFFFSSSIPCVSDSLSAFHVAPHARVHATTCDDQRPGGALFSGFRIVPSGCPFCFTLLLRVALGSVGTLIPATGWHSAYSCQRPSSWSDVCDFVDQISVQPQFF